MADPAEPRHTPGDGPGRIGPYRPGGAGWPRRVQPPPTTAGEAIWQRISQSHSLLMPKSRSSRHLYSIHPYSPFGSFCTTKKEFQFPSFPQKANGFS